MSYLGLDGHERGNITAAAFYGCGAAAGANFAGPFQPHAGSPGPAAQSDGGGLFGQLGDLVRFKEAGYLTEEEFTAAKAKILGIGGY
jgi:hypothetical protein